MASGDAQGGARSQQEGKDTKKKKRKKTLIYLSSFIRFSPIDHVKRAPPAAEHHATRNDPDNPRTHSKCKWTKVFTTEKQSTISRPTRTAPIDPLDPIRSASSSAIPQRPLTVSSTALAPHRPSANTTSNPNSNQFIHPPDTMKTCTTPNTDILPTEDHRRVSTPQEPHPDPKPRYDPPNHHLPHPVRAVAVPHRTHPTAIHQHVVDRFQLVGTPSHPHHQFPKVK